MQDARSIYKNKSYYYTPAVNNLKMKLRGKFHLKV